MMISDEHKILVCAARLEPNEQDFQNLRHCMAAGIDTGHLINLAVKEGLAGFLYRSLLKADLLDTLRPCEKQRLYHTYYLTIRHNLKLIHALNELLKLLTARQVRVILMQGISLLQGVYRDIGLRPMNDMDVWVLPNQYADLVDCLLSQGFKRNSIYPDTFCKGEVVLDIHTHILWAERIESRDLLINLDQEEIFSNAQLIKVEDGAGWCLNPADQFLYLAMHALKHNLERLLWLVDLCSLAAKWKPADWQVLTARAEVLGQKMQLFYMLFVLTKIFNLDLPAETSAYSSGWKPNFFERRALERRVKGRPLSTVTQLYLISAGKSLCDRISLVKETLFPRPKILRQVFSDAPDLRNSRLYWKRFLQILASFKPY
jgi:hypothetical protein